jgi:hypothetical protein
VLALPESPLEVGDKASVRTILNMHLAGELDAGDEAVRWDEDGLVNVAWNAWLPAEESQRAA